MLPVALPKNLLYATSARIGGSGLDQVAAESLKVSAAEGFLAKALAFENRQEEVAAERITTLQWHPVRLLSCLGSQHYYAAKKHALDRAAASALATGRFDCFHGWSGECLRSLRKAKERGIPTLIEIPTWHRNKGRIKPDRLTQSERERVAAGGFTGWKDRLLITRQQMLEEYALADRILVLSQKAEETFLAAGIAPEKLFRHQRGVDVERFVPAPSPPELFRVVFVGALIKRKGVHHILKAWHDLKLPNAELVLVGSLHEEMRPYLAQFGGENVKLPGFVPRVECAYQSAAVHLFPSSCEGSAKTTYEAAACGLAQITTRESGDVVLDGVNGILIEPENPEAIACALESLHRDRDLCARLGAEGRRRVLEHFTWKHFRERLLEAYRTVVCLA